MNDWPTALGLNDTMDIKRPKRRRPKFIESVLPVIIQPLKRELPDLPDETVYYLAYCVMESLITRFNGASFYVPVSACNSKEARDKAILASYDGTVLSVKRLAKRYRITDIHVYRILARQLGPRRQKKPQDGAEGQEATADPPATDTQQSAP